MALNIGIDFGTSTIFITRWNEKKKQAEPIPNITRSSAEKFIENIVYYESKDNIILGQRAKNKGVIYPQNMVNYIKRNVENNHWSTEIQSLNASVDAPTVIHDIFKFLKNRIEEIHGNQPIDSVVLSVPMSFEEQERQIIQQSAEKAGLNVIKLIEEPISAGISYGFFHDESFNVDQKPLNLLIFDLGGGTFDVAILKLFKQNNELNIEVLGTGGDKLLGGKDIDDIIFYKLCKQLNIKLTEIDQKLSRRDINDLKNEAKNAKEILSEAGNHEIIFQLRDLNQVIEYEITVDNLNEWLIESNFINKIQSTLNSSLQKANFKPNQIDKIILVGGTSNIPLIQKTLNIYFKKPIEMPKNPAELVGEGNGILCGSLNDHQLKFNLSFANQKQKIAKIEEHNGIQIKPKTIEIIDEQGWEDRLNWINQYRKEYHQITEEWKKAPNLNNIQQLFDLKELLLVGNQLTTLPNWIGNLKNLTVLNVAGNQLENIPDSIGKLENLITLNMAGNQLNKLPDSIGNLKNLTKLLISSNQLTKIPELIGELKQLIQIDVSKNFLDNMPDSIGFLTNLIELYLSENQLTTLPNSIGNLKNLIYLNISENQLNKLPDSMENLRKLTHFIIDDNKFIVFPNWIQKLTQLTYLSIKSNELNELNDKISSLKNLKVLKLCRNKLKEIPNWIGDLTNLNCLDLSETQLVTLPESLKKLSNLSNLSIDYNQLEKLPSWIGDLTNLTTISIRSNRLHTLPDSIGNLKNLTYLCINDNQFTILSESLKNLQNLEHLDIGWNKLIMIPSYMQKLTKLTFLNIEQNKLDIDSIDYLRTLQQINSKLTIFYGL